MAQEQLRIQSADITLLTATFIKVGTMHYTYWEADIYITISFYAMQLSQSISIHPSHPCFHPSPPPAYDIEHARNHIVHVG